MEQWNSENTSKFFKKNAFIKDVLIFAVIILGFHFFYRAWANWWSFWPVNGFIVTIRDLLAEQVFVHSTWIDVNILGLDLIKEGRQMIFPDFGYISINLGCSGFKQIMQFVVLMLIFPGPWKHKLWFIPIGVFIVHLTNLFRIVGLSVITINYPEYWHFSHDNFFRPFFYVVMFLMWVVWVEKFRVKQRVGE